MEKSFIVYGIGFLLTYIFFKFRKGLVSGMNSKSLLNKVVVITGASSGLGEALAHQFYKEGCIVVLCARRRQELDRVKNDLVSLPCSTPNHTPIIVPLDLSDINSLPGVVDKILSITKKIDILVNNGGISHRGSVLDTKLEVDMKIMTVNYFGSVALTKAVLPSMVKEKCGRIVFISSVQGLIAIPYRSSYAASKHALQAFADSLRAEISHHNIGVTVASPGYVKTALSMNALTATGKTYGKMDTDTEEGYTCEYASQAILKAVLEDQKEVVIANVTAKIGIFLRNFIPSLYFVAMVKRAKKLMQK
ncbi:dehydrogenase/reductase SDR family protein 7-like [Coccinella septempunctata]|uniref:dehydrogenase/reductase SDR family protein 7-like n=1 Tax=Coccinella septempunctata TaxID=41139 RepID=UPI001D05E69F|nr:dehydrogenase/reductase SDR family protein 7-like [Coccinella septempunctata]